MRSITHIFKASLLIGLLSLSACTTPEKLMVRTSLPLLEGGIKAMQKETDLELAKQAMPANLKMLEGLHEVDPDNKKIRLYLAEAYQGYALAFVQDEDPSRAIDFYERCIHYAWGVFKTTPVEDMTQTEFDAFLQHRKPADIDTLFWSASCLATSISQQLHRPDALALLGRAAAMMEKVLDYDEAFYDAGPHLFFGVYYGARPAMFGGDPERAAQHFDRAKELTGGTLLIVDVMRAEFLDRQLLDQAAFEKRLQTILNTRLDLDPENALLNTMAKDKARRLLSEKDEWF